MEPPFSLILVVPALLCFANKVPVLRPAYNHLHNNVLLLTGGRTVTGRKLRLPQGSRLHRSPFVVLLGIKTVITEKSSVLYNGEPVDLLVHFHQTVAHVVFVCYITS